MNAPHITEYLLGSGLCDPAIEFCSENDTLARPGVSSLLQLTLTYYANIWMVLVSILFLVWLDDVTPWKSSTGTEQFAYLLIWFLMILYHVVIFLPPALTLTIYLIFGSDFLLFRWTDNLSFYFVTQGTLNGGFWCHVINSLFILALYLRWFKLYELEFWLAYLSLAFIMEYS